MSKFSTTLLRWAGPPVAVLLVLLALGNLARSFMAVSQPRELMYGESIIYGQAARILEGEPLYQAVGQPPYTVTAYGPLYYWLVAGLRALVGPGFAPGRALSILAGVAATLLVARLANRHLRGGFAGVTAAVMFLALGFPGIDPWSALYKEDVLAVALSLGAVALLTSGAGFRHCMLAALLAGLAVLTKQTFVAASLAGAIWLLRRDRRHALVFVVIDAVVVLASTVVLELQTHAFLANAVLANVNPYRLDTLSYNLLLLGLMQGLPVLLAGLYVWWTRPWRCAEGELLVLYWIAATLPLLGLAKVGASHNYWLEFAAITAVLASGGVHRLRTNLNLMPSRRVLLGCSGALGAYLLIALPTMGVSALPRPSSVQRKPVAAGAFANVIERIEAQPGDVLADPLDLAVLANKPVMFETYLFSILYAQGRWDPGSLVESICDGDVGTLALDYPIEEAPLHGGYGYPTWPAPVLGALRQTMQLDDQEGGVFIYTRRPSAVCTAPSSDG